MEKASDAFRTISEVAEELDLPQHVLRFWETKFNQIRPMKRGGGRRYYRPDDVELLKGIQYLLYGEGYTIKGVQRILKEQGPRFVMELWHHPGMPIPADAVGEGDNGASDDDEAMQFVDNEDYQSDEDETPQPVASGPAPAAPEVRVAARDVSTRPVQAPFMAAAVAKVAAPAVQVEEEVLPSGILPDDAPMRAGFKFMDRFRGAGEAPQVSGKLSREDIRRLQSTLFELLECKRLLDQTR